MKKRRYGSSMGVFEWFRRPGPSVPAPVPPARLPFQLPTNEDLYEVFGLTPNASETDIRQAFKEQAIKFHPDRNPGDPVAERKYREITETYRILMDPQMRAAYDAWRGGRPAPGVPPRQPPRATYPMQIPQPPGPAAPPTAAPRAPQALTPGAPSSRIPSPWEVMYGPGTEQTPPAGMFFTTFGPPAGQVPARPVPPPQFPPQFTRPAGAPAPQPPPRPTSAMAPAYPTGMPPALARMDLPSVEEIAQLIYHTWPLEEIWPITRTERQRPAFAQTGVVHVEQIAGFRPGALEYELGEDLGLPPWFIEQYLAHGKSGFETLWNQVFAPMFDLVTEAFDRLKPADLYGKFGIDVDPQGTRADLLYSERSR